MKNYCIIHILLFVLLMLVYQCSHAQSIRTNNSVGQRNAADSCENIGVHHNRHPDPQNNEIAPFWETVVEQGTSAWDEPGRTAGKYSEQISNRVRETWRQAITRLDFTDEVNAWLKCCAEEIIALIR